MKNTTVRIFIALFLLNLTTAQFCKSGCGLCSNNRQTCYSCLDPLTFKFQGGTCDLVTIPVDNCLVYSADNICSVCVPGTYLQNGVCILSADGCIEYKDSQTCSRCGLGTFLLNGVCQGVMNCRDFDRANNKCLVCQQGFFLFDDDLCFPDSCEQTDVVMGGCITCPEDHFLNSYSCIPNKFLKNFASGCSVISPRGACRICSQGYTLDNQTCTIVQSKFQTDITSVVSPSSFQPLYSSVARQNLGSSSIEQVPQQQPTFSKKPTDPQPIQTQAKANTINSPSSPQLQPLPQFQARLQSTQQLKNGSQSIITVSPQTQKSPTYIFTSSNSLPPTMSNVLQTITSINSPTQLQISPRPGPLNCQTVDFTNKQMCSVCLRGYYLLSNRTCAPQAVDKNCLAYGPAGTCILCSQGYFRKNICVPIPPQCLNPDLPTARCGNCTQGYSLDNGSCSPVANFDTNCIWYSNQICQSCAYGLSLSISGKCIKKSIYCLSADPQTGNCLTCHDKFVPYGSSCIDPACTIPIDGFCPQCNQGYQLIDNICEHQVIIPNCVKKQNGKCIECSYRFFLSDNRCLSVSDKCALYNSSTGACLSCQVGLKFINGQCVDRNCAKANQKGCSDCVLMFYLLNGSCLRIPVDNCQIFKTDRCQKCLDKFTLTQNRCIAVNPIETVRPNVTTNNTIRQTTATVDPNCKVYKNQQCLNCSNGFYKKDGMCVSVSPLCKTYNPNSGICFSCFPGYSLAGTECVVTSALTLNNNQNSCLRPSANNPKLCEVCAQGYTLGSNRICSLTKQDPNCKTTKNNICIQCSRGFTMSNNGSCLMQNPLCKSVDKITGGCESCFNGYILSLGNCVLPITLDPSCIRSSGSSCIQCTERYYLQGRSCVPVTKNCGTYNNLTGLCTSCSSSLQLVNGDCISKRSEDPYCQNSDPKGNCIRCLFGFYLNTNTKQCTQISILCSNFDDTKQACTQCQPGYFLQDNQCIYPSMGIDENCVRYEGSYCATCANKYYLFNYICAPVDENCVNFDYTTNTCLSCTTGVPTGTGCM